jgi:hypothetical protein
MECRMFGVKCGLPGNMTDGATCAHLPLSAVGGLPLPSVRCRSPPQASVATPRRAAARVRVRVRVRVSSLLSLSVCLSVCLCPESTTTTTPANSWGLAGRWLGDLEMKRIESCPSIVDSVSFFDNDTHIADSFHADLTPLPASPSDGGLQLHSGESDAPPVWSPAAPARRRPPSPLD